MTRTNIKKLGLIPVVALGLFAIAVPALASASSQTFNVLDNKSLPGMLMSLTANSDVVEPANEKNASALLGIISNDNSEITSTPKAGQVNIQTEGKATALVSTLGGDVLIGDRIGPSSLAGIGTKISGSGWIVGIAQASVDSKTKGAVAATVTDTKGKKHEVHVASIPIVMHVTYYTAPGSNADSSGIPHGIQKIADRIAGKHVSLIGVLLSFLLLIVGVVAAAIIINSTIRGAFVAIARQPLSKAMTFRTLGRSLSVAGGIIVFVFVAAWLVLRLL